MFLSDYEIEKLTKRKRPSAQQRQLNAMGIQHKVRADGSLVILHVHVEKLLGGQVQSERKRPIREPNWEALVYA
ncbi:hypothetical protein RB25_02960 [Herbaspirillum rubrisubalbicans]|uniref:DUF4224 domain-containing protein n=1 Tax=Herbaspirillum rubrisubalbicans TaxID=80842 RepID=UPI000DC26FC4|nr:DUF4224 domain-containing protein [Herbaspirillum rubrisubalbicans]RAN50160.1 hypothetical protein RB25_02960 [Herbaspirillum rubrisubalbicans]